jgi:hypothetical protein
MASSIWCRMQAVSVSLSMMAPLQEDLAQPAIRRRACSSTAVHELGLA